MPYIPNIRNSPAKVLLVHNGGWGEKEHIQHIKIAARRLGWDLRHIDGNVITNNIIVKILHIICYLFRFLWVAYYINLFNA